jgi:hypothetical protein
MNFDFQNLKNNENGNNARETKIELKMISDGVCNAIIFWYNFNLRLKDGLRVCHEFTHCVLEFMHNKSEFVTNRRVSLRLN